MCVSACTWAYVCPPQLSHGRECELSQQLDGVQQQEEEELRSRLAQLEEDKRTLSAQLQEARGILTSCPAVTLQESTHSTVTLKCNSAENGRFLFCTQKQYFDIQLLDLHLTSDYDTGPFFGHWCCSCLPFIHKCDI